MFPSFGDRRLHWGVFVVGAVSLFVSASLVGAADSWSRASRTGTPTPERHALSLIDQGRHAFRFDSAGDEELWSRSMFHDALRGVGSGGIRQGLSLREALRLGLKVDIDALSPELQMAIVAGQVDFHDPQVTIELLRLNAIVGVTAAVRGENQLESVRLQCAVCHSTVDDSLIVGIGRRLDGWANRDLDLGQLLARAPDVSPVAAVLGTSDSAAREVLESWGPGKIDTQLFFEGLPAGSWATASAIPPVFGRAGVNLAAHGGAQAPPVAPVFAALHFYLWSLPAPEPD